MSIETEKLWRKKHPLKFREWALTYRLKHPERVILHSAKRRSKLYNLPFNLTEADIIIPSHCPVLGIPIFISWAHSHIQRNSPNAPSLDRIDNSLGYIKGNVQIISWRANNLKKNATSEELFAVARFVRDQEAFPCWERH